MSVFFSNILLLGADRPMAMESDRSIYRHIVHHGLIYAYLP